MGSKFTLEMNLAASNGAKEVPAPGDEGPPSSAAAAAGLALRDKGKLESFEALQVQRENRYRIFREGLRDLVYSLYTGLCAAFYVIPPPGSPDNFTCLFQAKGIQVRAHPFEKRNRNGSSRPPR